MGYTKGELVTIGDITMGTTHQYGAVVTDAMVTLIGKTFEVDAQLINGVYTLKGDPSKGLWESTMFVYTDKYPKEMLVWDNDPELKHRRIVLGKLTIRPGVERYIAVYEHNEKSFKNGTSFKTNSWINAENYNIPTLPRINGDNGKLISDSIVYGCAKFDIHQLLELHKVVNTFGKNDITGNRRISRITLDSSVVINNTELEAIVKYIKEYAKI